ncbi:MAG: FAD-binding protein, partial [Actinobacteria bacterium]|nr:FAD-binding protein [Actinomycetota bacterium]
MSLSAVVDALSGALRDDQLVRDPAQLRTYECDGLTAHRVVPGLVVLAESAAEVQAAVRACNAAGVPFVARGAGTGLSGGALPVEDGIVISLARLDRILELDLDAGLAVVEPGVANLDVTRAVAADGFYYAPDPSSQQVCTIGGNVAENSGGAHCLKYGFTVNHVLAAEVVLPDGELVELSAWDDGPDLLGLFVGSEGTLGIATKLTLRLLRAPEAVVTLLAGFAHTDDAGAAVSATIAAGVLPAAIEMMDAITMEAAEKAVGANYPDGCGAALIVELDGPAAQVEEDLARVEEICRETGAIEVRIASDPTDRATVWRGRKAAFAAMGRVSPDYYVQDGVVPRTKLPEVLRRIDALSQEAGLRVGNVFHAGDGNLHPLVLYDGRVEGQAKQAEELAKR